MDAFDQFILIKTARFESCEKMSGIKKNILSIEEHVKVVDRLVKGESAEQFTERTQHADPDVCKRERRNLAQMAR